MSVQSGQPQGAMAVGMIGIHMTAGATTADHAAADLNDVIDIVNASLTPERHEIVTTPTGIGVYGESGVSGAPGVPLSDQNTTIHTIGIGTVPGTKWQELIESISAETGGLHHFTSAPDTELVDFLEDDLVAALQTGSVYRVARVKNSIGTEEQFSVDVPLNPTISKLAVRSSWGSSLKEGFIEVRLVRLDDSGTAMATFAPSNTHRGKGWTVPSWELPLREADQTIPVEGDWQVVALLKGRLPSDTKVPVTVSVLVDDGRLKTRVGSTQNAIATGEPIPIEMNIALGTDPVEGATVEVVVSPPGTALGSLLSEHCPGKPKGQPGSESFDSTEACIETIVRDVELPDFIGDASRLELQHVGGGKYTAVFASTTIPGSYRFSWMVRGNAGTASFQREGTFTRVVNVRDFDTSSISLAGSQLPNGSFLATFEVTPRDNYGNLLGPGYGARIAVSIPGVAHPMVEDRLDGSYHTEVELEDPEALYESSVIIKGERVSPSKSQIDRALFGPGWVESWWIWLLLLVATIVVVIAVRYWRSAP